MATQRTLTFENIGRNTKAAYDASRNVVILEMDVSKTAMSGAPSSKEGKNLVPCSTGGFKEVGPVRLSVNAIAPLTAKVSA